ncbi:MAG: ABC transporter permease [Caulobacteraceae bacterium]
MLGHYLLTLYRALTRHRLYAALNVLGLAVGIAVFLVLWLDVRFETGFERWIPNADQIYAIRSAWIGKDAGPPSTGATMGVLLDQLRADYPQLVGARVLNSGGAIREGSHVTTESLNAVDPDFFKVFDLPLIAGDKATLLSSPRDIVLSQSKARQYFGSGNPIGRRLSVAFGGVYREYRVAGVLKEPAPATEQRFDFLIPLKRPTVAEDAGWYQWGNLQLQTFLRFTDPAQARALDADFDRFTDRHAGKDLDAPAHENFRLRTSPLLAAHLIDPKDAAVVAGLGAVGLLTLLLAAVNYVNLETARAGLRAREIAVRKVMGATGPILVVQFMAEALMTVALAALIGLALCEAALPLVNTAGGLSLKVHYFGQESLLAVLALVVGVVGLGAGLYPALILARFQPAAVLASAKTPGGGRSGARVREGLVVIQFAIAIAFTAATGVIVSQTSYLRRADIGFQRTGLIVVNSFDDPMLTQAQQANMLAAWRALPGILSVTAADIAPGVNDSTWANNTQRPGRVGDGPSLQYVRNGPAFLQTYGARLLAGRLPDLMHGGDFPPASAAVQQTPRNVVLNAGAVRTLGFSSAQASVGQPLRATLSPGVYQALRVIGVVGDIRFRSPRAPVPPTVYLPQGGAIDNAAVGVRYSAVDARAVLDRIGSVWRSIAPEVPFRGRTIEGNLEHYYRADDQHGRLFSLGAVLAVAIGCIGLYGMASFNTARRVREIGIRKTLGASTSDILGLLIGQFMRPVLLANLIAWPLAWLAMRDWLAGFDQRIDLGLQYFLAATVLTLVIALGTVAGQAFAIARAEPAKALRHE